MGRAGIALTRTTTAKLAINAPRLMPLRANDVQAADIGNTRMRQLQEIDSVEKWRDHAAAKQLDLPGEQQVPHGMILLGERLPALRDDIILPPLERPVPGDRLLKHS